MLNEFCISMPYLHPAPAFRQIVKKGAYTGEIKYLWPGHGEASASSAWQPPSGYPFQIREAARIMNDIKNQTLPELERMRHLARRRLHEEERKFRAEMDSLAVFAEQKEELSSFSNESIARQAQLSLLWLWLMEERFLEINSLALRCEDEESRLLDAVYDCSEKPLYLGARGFEEARELLPDWKTVFLNAAFFIDPKLPILLEGSMREDLDEYFKGSSAEFWGGLRKAELPLWRILGISRPRDSALSSGFWDEPRLLIWEP